ncbi:MAG TPA: HlyD family secretion protein [Kofleriaceae bacterium]|jgi:membrane fusion protein (multidrug efflux system)|nr:HlyD family secretion protein [Kofleriaceae bacterium]
MEAASKDTAALAARRRRAKNAYLILAVGAAAVALLWFVHRWWTHDKEDTDDATVEADVVLLSPRVGGVIKTARVQDHQAVKAGDVLFEIDPADLDVEVARCDAELQAAQAQQAAADAQVGVVQSSSTGGLSSARAALTGAGASVRGAEEAMRAAQALVERAKADLATAESDLKRQQDLYAQKAGTGRDVEHAQQARDVAKASLDAANAQLAMARDQHNLAQSRVAEAEGHVTQSTPVDQAVAAAQANAKLAAARVKAAQVALDKATLQRSYATVTAPAAGKISKLAARAGQQVMAGQPLLNLVPVDSYVIANFKEGQIGRMKTGDPVDIEIDAFPGQTFHGVVDTVSPATGARFSMIPPDNATGNFVKVVQRVPVKIRWSSPPAVEMKPGLSAEVTVHVGG